MQKSIFIPLVAVSALVGCSDPYKTISESDSATSTVSKKVIVPEWVGKYQGNTPCFSCSAHCEDCTGMDVALVLKADHAYELTRISLSGNDKNQVIKGIFKFNNPEQSQIELIGVDVRNLILVDLERHLLEIRQDQTGDVYPLQDAFSLGKNIA